jgi:hypothetical protein
VTKSIGVGRNMSNPGGINLNSNPYYDDYDEGKKFVRVLFNPGRAVQGRELTQLQTYLQKQIERFGDYFFDEGAIIDGCEQNLNLSLKYVKIQDTYENPENNDSVTVDITDFENKTIRSSTTGVTATIRDYVDIEGNDPKTLYLNYLSSGNVVLDTQAECPSTLVVGNTITGATSGATAKIAGFNTLFNKIYLKDVSGTFQNETVTTTDNTLTDLNIVIESVNDYRTSNEFLDNEYIFDVANPRTIVASTLTENSTRTTISGEEFEFASRITIGEGIVYIADHFIKIDKQSVLLDKYSNKPSYKVGFLPTKEFVDHLEDLSLVDNAQGTPNFAAPGADRLKIDIVLTKTDLTVDTSQTEFISILDIDNGIVQSRRTKKIEKQLETQLAQRTFEESGNYTLNPPKVTVREHLKQDDNNGKYLLSEGGDADKLLVGIEPITAYVRGYRYEYIQKTETEVDKSLDTLFVEQNKLQTSYGNYFLVNEVSGLWDLNEATEVELHSSPYDSVSNETYANTSYTSSTLIGTARVRSFNHNSGVLGESDTTFRMYLFDIQITDPEYTVQDVRGIYFDSTVNSFADVVLESTGNAKLKETGFNRALFQLPFDAVKTIRDEDGNVETGFRFKKSYDITFTNGAATISSFDTSETFVGTGLLSDSVKNENYTVVVTNNGANAIGSNLTGTVTVSAASNSVSGVSTDFTGELQVGDYLQIGSEVHRVASITGQTSLTLDENHATGASGQNFQKVIKPGMIIDMNGNGSAGSRTIRVSSPGTVQFDIKDTITFTAQIIVTMDRSNAAEMKKIIQADAEVTIDPDTHPNAYAGPYSLGKSDVISISAIYQSADVNTAPTTSDTNVTDSFNFDNGQRDNFYDHGRITPKTGFTPTGQLLVVFDYFSHDISQGVGYLSVDSYPIDDDNVSDTTIKTEDIPVYTDSLGTTFDLRNTIDFRLRIEDSAATLNPTFSDTFQTPVGGLHVPKPNSDFDTDLIVYLRKKVKLYIDKSGKLATIAGAPGVKFPSIDPVPPVDVLSIATLEIPPYPSKPKDVIVRPFTTKRFTMKDIGKIEKRVKNLEYYTSLSLLERKTADLKVLDDQGLDRFKNGFVVDNFSGFSVADVKNADFAAAIDKKNRELRPKINLDHITLGVDSTSFDNSVQTEFGKKVFVNYTEEVFSENVYASKPLNLVEEILFTYDGTLRVTPSTDNWVDTVNPPEEQITLDLTGISDNFKYLLDAWNVEFGSWQEVWTGEYVEGTARTNQQQRGNAIYNVTTQEEVGTDQLIGLGFNAGEDQTIDFNRVVRSEIVNVMRGRDIVLTARGMKPGSKLHVFFDDVNVDEHVRPIRNLTEHGDVGFLDNGYIDPFFVDTEIAYTGDFGDALYADETGEMLCLFRLPAKTFFTGQRAITVVDDEDKREGFITTQARGTFYAQGLSTIQGSTTINTRPVTIVPDAVVDENAITRRVETDSTFVRRVFRTHDPVSQSFFIDEGQFPEGMMITAIDTYFYERDEDNPDALVMLEIREMDNGFPTRKTVGSDAIVYKKSSQIAVSDDASASTKFVFDNPVFLKQDAEYVFTIKALGNNDKFRLWISELGELDVSGTDGQQRIEKSPYGGVLFTSSNDRTWTARQKQDAKYTIYRAKFDTSAPGSFVLQNLNIDDSKDFVTFAPDVEEAIFDRTGITYEVEITDTAGNLTGYNKVQNKEAYYYNYQGRVLDSTTESNRDIKSVKLKATLRTTSEFISPYIDLERTHGILIDNLTNNDYYKLLTGTFATVNGSQSVTGTATLFDSELQSGEYIEINGVTRKIESIASNTALTLTSAYPTSTAGLLAYSQKEEFPNGPYASDSRYITRRVVLNEGFDASDLKVLLKVNRPAGANIKVYYKIQNAEDSDSFDDKFYHEMELDGELKFSSSDVDFIDEEYIIPEANKTGGFEILTGVVQVTGSSSTVAGTGTAFLEELKIGDTIEISGETKIVTNIVSNEELQVDTNFTSTASGTEAIKVLNNEVAYTTLDGRRFTGFKTMAIKIAFLSDNPAIVPKIKDMRAIALS